MWGTFRNVLTFLNADFGDVQTLLPRVRGAVSSDQFGQIAIREIQFIVYYFYNIGVNPARPR